MSDLEKISQILKEGFDAKLNNTEKQGLLSSEQVLTIMFDAEGEMQFAIVQGADGESDNEFSSGWWNDPECIKDCLKCAHQHECIYFGQELVF